ncbi:MAG: sigma-70 family RNA polymerase sigma factor, partial [Sandaracinaceae bacterium]|nr:sigma-70 family RNA polymerase sigma factor [Sandaracinaceae bacterium]
MSAQSEAVAVPELDVGAVYDAHASFVWGSLYRLGVATSDLPDLTQEVFAVVHRRRDAYDSREPIKPWLWGICLGLVRNYRRRAFRHRERLRAEPPEVLGADDPEEALEERRAKERGERALAALDP